MEFVFFMGIIVVNDLTSHHDHRAVYLIAAHSQPEAEAVLKEQARTMYGNDVQEHPDEFRWLGEGGMRTRVGSLVSLSPAAFKEASVLLPVLLAEGIDRKAALRPATPIPGYSNLGLSVPGEGMLWSVPVTMDTSMSAKVLVRARNAEDAAQLARETASNHAALLEVDDCNYKGTSDYYIPDRDAIEQVASPMDFGLPAAAQHKFSQPLAKGVRPDTCQIVFGFKQDDFFISEPGISECGRFDVCPETHYEILRADASAVEQLNQALDQARFDDGARDFLDPEEPADDVNEPDVVGPREAALASAIEQSLRTSGNTVTEA